MKTDNSPKWVTPAIMSTREALLTGARLLVDNLSISVPSVRRNDAQRAVMLGMLRAACSMARDIDLDEADVINCVKIDFKNS